MTNEDFVKLLAQKTGEGKLKWRDSYTYCNFFCTDINNDTIYVSRSDADDIFINEKPSGQVPFNISLPIKKMLINAIEVSRAKSYDKTLDKLGKKLNRL